MPFGPYFGGGPQPLSSQFGPYFTNSPLSLTDEDSFGPYFFLGDQELAPPTGPFEDIGPLELNALPTAPSIVVPANGATFFIGNGYTVEWTAATDADDPVSSLKYNLQVKKAGEIVFSDADGQTFDAEANADLTDAAQLTLNITTLLTDPEGIWAFRVRAWDGSHFGAFSAERSINMVVNVAPELTNGGELLLEVLEGENLIGSVTITDFEDDPVTIKRVGDKPSWVEENFIADGTESYDTPLVISFTGLAPLLGSESSENSPYTWSYEIDDGINTVILNVTLVVEERDGKFLVKPDIFYALVKTTKPVQAGE